LRDFKAGGFGPLVFVHFFCCKKFNDNKALQHYKNVTCAYMGVVYCVHKEIDMENQFIPQKEKKVGNWQLIAGILLVMFAVVI